MAENSTSIEERYKEILERTYSKIQNDSLTKTALIDAVRYNADNGLLALAIIHAGFDVNITNVSNKTALFYAAYNRSRKDGLLVAQKLIANGANVNIIDSGGETALFFAVIYKNIEVVRALTDAGADVNTVNKEGETALFYAGNDDMGEICKTLIDAGADVNIIDSGGETALFFAVTNRNIEVVRALIDAGSDVNTINNEGKTALFYAGNDDMGEICKTLIDAGAEVNITDNEKNTALFYGIRCRNENMVCALIKAGITVNTPLTGIYKDRLMPLTFAIFYDNENVVSALVETADLTLTDDKGKAALHHAVIKCKTGAVKTLIDAGADVNITDGEGKTALFYAVQSGEQSVPFLIDAGADVNITDAEGKTALIYAVQQRNYKNNESLVRKLISAGVDVNISDNEGKTALFYAVQESNNESVIRALIDVGADVNAIDNDGKTALFFAIENSGPLSSALCLLENGADLYVKDDFNINIFTLFVEDCIKRCIELEHSYSISSCMSEGLKCFLEKGVQIQIVYAAILNVVFCRVLESTPKSLSMAADSCRADRYIQPFREVLEKLMEFAIEEDRENILKEILMMLNNFDISRLPKILDLLVKLGADPNSVDSKGNTALHYATRLPFYGVPKETVIDVIQQLKGFGIRMNRKNRQNASPLLFCLCGEFPKLEDVTKKESRVKVLEEVVRFLLDCGLSTREITHSEKFSFHLILDIFSQCSTLRRFRPLASGYESPRSRRVTTKELLQVMVRVLHLIPCEDTHAMVHKRDVKLDGVIHLLASLKLRSPEEYSETDEDGGLTFKKIMKLILEYFSRCEAKVNDRNAKEETPLHLCATWSAVKLLLEVGARPNDVDALGCTPLLRAAKDKLFSKKTDCFYPDVSEEPKVFWKATLERGLDPWTADNDGKTVLKILIESEQFVLANALVEVAVESGYLESDTIASSMLTTVCKDTSKTSHWKSILVEMILKSRNPIPILNNAKGKDLPLHICAANIIPDNSKPKIRKKPVVKTEVAGEESVHWTICKLLLSHGADYSIPDKNGQTCLDIAQEFPPLNNFLTTPIDISEIPVFIPWTSVSERYKHKLAKVARRQESEHVDSYWYHKEHLAHGSFGLVFAGINERDGREVAIKRIETLRMERREDLREISNLKALADCEQVIRYLSYFDDDANHFSYVVLELMEGSLEECLDTIPLEIDERVKHCKDVVIGLQFLHNLDILHRDLKPSNILYKTHPKLRLKIADFGLSRRIDSTATTVYGTNAGTRCWISPEVMMSLQDHSKSSDIFACGLVLHYILSVKRHPFAPADDTKKSLFEVNNKTEANMIANRMEGWDDSLNPEATHLVKSMLDNGTRRPSAAETLCHPFFWSDEKKVNLLTAVGNQPEFECPRAKRTPPLTAVETDLQARFGVIVKYGKWDDPRYLRMPSIDAEMRKHPRRYDTHSAVELVRYIRNAYAHVSALGRPSSIKSFLLNDFVFLEYFPNLVMEVYKAVTTHGWDQTREEINSAITRNK